MKRLKELEAEKVRLRRAISAPFRRQLSFVGGRNQESGAALKFHRHSIVKDSKMEAILFRLGIAVRVAALPPAWIKVTRRARDLARSNASLHEELTETRAALTSEKMWRLVTNVRDAQIAAPLNDGSRPQQADDFSQPMR
jgi:hypothetical protein